MNVKAILQGFTICSSFYGARFQTPSDPQELRLMAGLWADALAEARDAEPMAGDECYLAWESDQRRLVDAALHYRQAIELNPGHLEAHNNLAIVLEQQGQLPAAMEN